MVVYIIDHSGEVGGECVVSMEKDDEDENVAITNPFVGACAYARIPERVRQAIHTISMIPYEDLRRTIIRNVHSDMPADWTQAQRNAPVNISKFLPNLLQYQGLFDIRTAFANRYSSLRTIECVLPEELAGSMFVLSDMPNLEHLKILDTELPKTSIALYLSDLPSLVRFENTAQIWTDVKLIRLNRLKSCSSVAASTIYIQECALLDQIDCEILASCKPEVGSSVYTCLKIQSMPSLKHVNIRERAVDLQSLHIHDVPQLETLHVAPVLNIGNDNRSVIVECTELRELRATKITGISSDLVFAFLKELIYYNPRLLQVHIGSKLYPRDKF